MEERPISGARPIRDGGEGPGEGAKLREDGERELVKAMEQVRTITAERDALREEVKDLTDAGRPLCRLLVPL